MQLTGETHIKSVGHRIDTLDVLQGFWSLEGISSDLTITRSYDMSRHHYSPLLLSELYVLIQFACLRLQAIDRRLSARDARNAVLPAQLHTVKK